MDSIRAYIRVDVSGYPGNNGYPGSEEFGCSRVSGYQMDLHGFFMGFRIFLDFEYILSLLGSPGRVRVCCAACGASEPSEKTRPWNLGACTLCVLLLFVDLL